MRTALSVLVAVVAVWAPMPAGATHRPVYVPDYRCEHVITSSDAPDTEVCRLELRNGTHEVDLSAVFGTRGFFRVQAGLADGRVFWEEECLLDGDLPDWRMSCSGSGWGSSTEGLRSAYGEGFFVLTQAGMSGRLPDGGWVALWSGPGDGALVLTGRRVPG